MSDRRKLTQEERQTVLDRFCGRCAYCGKQITMQELNVDHLVPIRIRLRPDVICGLLLLAAIAIATVMR